MKMRLSPAYGGGSGKPVLLMLFAARQGLPLSLVLFDVDHFKSLNDAFGHPAGDGVLKALAAILRDQVRPYDQLARHGGEEFALVLIATDAAREGLNLQTHCWNLFHFDVPWNHSGPPLAAASRDREFRGRDHPAGLRERPGPRRRG